MIEQEKLPLSLKLENRISFRMAVLLTAVLFLLIFLPWLTSQRELFRHEGLYAAVAADFVDVPWSPEAGITAQAHNTLQRDVWPLYPALVSLLYRLSLPMETALRLISLIMLGILSLLAAFAAGCRSGKLAGIVAGCCCFGTLFALSKGVQGGPESMAACFLLAAQLLFFHYGSRLADWNCAWIASAFFLALGFLTSGPVVLLFFIFPLFFLRRPLSFAGKFRTPGFACGIILLLVVMMAWAYPFGIDLLKNPGGAELKMIASGEYWRDLLLFPVKFPLRFMPWTLVAWMPFCVALQAISPVPVFSRYLRTLFFSMAALVWLIPGISTELTFFVIGPLAVLTGLNYELGVRRYSGFLRKALTLGWIFFPAAILLVLAAAFAPPSLLRFLGDPEKMLFRETVSGYSYWAVGAVVLLILAFAVYCRGRCRLPVWAQIALISFGIGVVGAVELLPYSMMENGWRKFGSDVREVLPEDTARIYKYDIEGMYSGLFYVGIPVYRMQSLEELDGLEDSVYLISSRLPVYPGRVWTPLLPDDYTCRGIPVSVWRGVRRPDDEYDAGTGDE
ncbi:MAG: hypothetical protein J6S43_02665 [Lentisphaeria bacterium]|nr:hypothetical protein [Lentisphaeria bacterium]